MIDELKTYDTIHHHDNGPIFFGGGGIMPLGRKKRMIWWPYPTYYGGSDASQIFAVRVSSCRILNNGSICKEINTFATEKPVDFFYHGNSIECRSEGHDRCYSVSACGTHSM